MKLTYRGQIYKAAHTTLTTTPSSIKMTYRGQSYQQSVPVKTNPTISSQLVYRGVPYTGTSITKKPQTNPLHYIMNCLKANPEVF